MNKQETSEFVQQVAIAFPGLLELLEKSPATLGVWAKTLEQVSSRDAMRVLSRWIDGSLDNPPIGFRREMFALDVRSVAMRMRSDEMSKQASAEKIENGKRPRGQNATPAYDLCASFFAKVLPLNEQVINGTLLQQERDVVVAQLLEEAFK